MENFGENYYELDWKDFLEEVSRNTINLRTGHLEDVHKGRDSRFSIAKAAAAIITSRHLDSISRRRN